MTGCAGWVQGEGVERRVQGVGVERRVQGEGMERRILGPAPVDWLLACAYLCFVDKKSPNLKFRGACPVWKICLTIIRDMATGSYAVRLSWQAIRATCRLGKGFRHAWTSQMRLFSAKGSCFGPWAMVYGKRATAALCVSTRCCYEVEPRLNAGAKW